MSKDDENVLELDSRYILENQISVDLLWPISSSSLELKNNKVPIWPLKYSTEFIDIEKFVIKLIGNVVLNTYCDIFRSAFLNLDHWRHL